MADEIGEYAPLRWDCSACLPGEGAAAPMSEPRSESVLPVVGVELDSGPFDMAFGYVPIGVPAYSDVAADLWPQPTHAEAEMVGARMLAIGNWESFRIEKRWWPASVWQVEGAESGSSRGSDV